MTKRIAVLVENFYEENELWYPYHRLREAGHAPTLVGPTLGSFKGLHGYPAVAEAAAADVSAASFDGVVIPGGYSPDRLRRSAELVQLVRDCNDSENLVAAICHAGWMLAEADIVRDREVTGFHSIRVDVQNAGGIWSDEEVIVDANLVTSRSPEDLPAFMAAILTYLQN